jgi:hypothetical protein
VNTSLSSCFTYILRVAFAYSLHITRTYPTRVLDIQVLSFAITLSIDLQSDMAAPVPTMTVTVNIPLLAELLQTNHDLRREVSDLRIQLSARVQAIETHLISQRTDNSTLTVPSQDLGPNAASVHERRLGHEDLHIEHHVQINGSPNQNGHVQQDNPTQQNDRVDQDSSSRNTSRTSSPSVDEGLTIMDHVSLPPVNGRKRKRVVHPTVGTSPYINHSGFVVRDSDSQLAQRESEAGPSGSESPFDSTNDRPEPSSDQLEIMPPVRPQSGPPVPASRHRPQRSQAAVEQSDVHEANEFKQEEITLRYD